MMLLPGARPLLAGPLGRQPITPGRRSEMAASRRLTKILHRMCVVREEYYDFSSTLFSGRSPPAAVSVCHLPSAVSYSIASVRPGTRCSAAARLAAASAAGGGAKASENTPLTV